MLCGVKAIAKALRVKPPQVHRLRAYLGPADILDRQAAVRPSRRTRRVEGGLSTGRRLGAHPVRRPAGSARSATIWPGPSPALVGWIGTLLWRTRVIDRTFGQPRR